MLQLKENCADIYKNKSSGWGTCLLQVRLQWAGEDGRSLQFAVVMPGRKVKTYKKDFFYSENNRPLEQPPLGDGRAPITGGVQDVTGQGAR